MKYSLPQNPKEALERLRSKDLGTSLGIPFLLFTLWGVFFNYKFFALLLIHSLIIGILLENKEELLSSPKALFVPLVLIPLSWFSWWYHNLEGEIFHLTFFSICLVLLDGVLREIEVTETPESKV